MSKKRKNLPEFTIKDIEAWCAGGPYGYVRPMGNGLADLCWRPEAAREAWLAAGSPERFNALNVLQMEYLRTPDRRRLAAHMIPKGWRGFQRAFDVVHGGPGDYMQSEPLKLALEQDGYEPL